MTWRVANSLQTLLSQVNARWPDRDRVSDGSIGDPAHQNRDSDHNPWYPPPHGGIVTARDFTHDVTNGLDCHWLAEILRITRDPRVKYVIWFNRIMSGNSGPSPWVWRNYTGTNPHTHHLHLSVVATSQCDNPAPWAGVSPAPSAQPASEVDMPLTNADVTTLTGGSYFWNGRWRFVAAGLAAAEDTVGVLATVLAKVTNDPDITRDEVKDLMKQAIEEIGSPLDEAAIAALVVQQIGSRTDIAPETVQEIADASAAAIAGRMAS